MSSFEMQDSAQGAGGFVCPSRRKCRPKVYQFLRDDSGRKLQHCGLAFPGDLLHCFANSTKAFSADRAGTPFQLMGSFHDFLEVRALQSPVQGQHLSWSFLKE